MGACARSACPSQTYGDSARHSSADAWHRRVIADHVVAHAFSHGFHRQHVERLAAYWAEAFGGPTMYCDFYVNETIVVKTAFCTSTSVGQSLA